MRAWGMESLSQGDGISHTLPSYPFSIPTQSTWLERPSPLHTHTPSCWEACPAMCFPQPHLPGLTHTTLLLHTPGQQPNGGPLSRRGGPWRLWRTRGVGTHRFPLWQLGKSRPESESCTVWPAQLLESVGPPFPGPAGGEASR